MTRPSLKLYLGPDSEPRVVPTSELRHRVSLNELIGILRHAIAHQRAWLHDLGDEEIAISEDLHEVLAAYERLAKTAASSPPKKSTDSGLGRAESA